MVYYDALVAAWDTTTLPSGVIGTPLSSSMTTVQKLAAINGWTVAGPNVNVAPSSIAAYLALNLKLAALLNYAKSPPATEAGQCAVELVALFNMGSNAPTFQSSNPTVYETLSAMLNAMAGDTNSGITSSDVTALLALATPSISWCQANGYPFQGLTGLLNSHDLVGAGLTTLVLSAPTAIGSNVLNVASVPTWLTEGMEAHDLGADGTDIPPGATVASFTSNTITITENVTGSGLAAGDTIGFA